MNTPFEPFEEYDPSLGTYEEYQQLAKIYDGLQREYQRVMWERDCYKLSYKFNVWTILLRNSGHLKPAKGRHSATGKQYAVTRLKSRLRKVQDAVINHGFNEH